MMNGQFVTQMTDPDIGLLAAVINFPDMQTEERIETLYLAALGRKPRPAELKRMIEHCSARELPVALSDIFWAILNSSELLLDH